jgi:hypothetical protein
MAIRGRRHEVPASIVGEVRGHNDGEGELRRVARLEVRFAPIAWLVGVGFTGFGVGGFRGAGIALMLPATLVFIAALIDPPAEPGAFARHRRKRTLRHRYFLWLDRSQRKAEARRQRRVQRKEAERRYLERRDRGR